MIGKDMQSFYKTSFFIIFALGLLVSCDNTSTEVMIDIPDRGFLDALIGQGVDENGDGTISTVEAEAFTFLVIPPSEISDLRGLEAFINLDSFSITLNPLSGIDLSANTSLRYLECTSCELSTLDVSKNPLLETLICGRNSLSELDISLNQLLLTLVLNNNLFTSLDLSANTRLTKMISCGNQLTSLDISRHNGLKTIGVDNMPMLTEVCVWTLPFPPEGIVVLQGFSPNITFTTFCSK